MTKTKRHSQSSAVVTDTSEREREISDKRERRFAKSPTETCALSRTETRVHTSRLTARGERKKKKKKKTKKTKKTKKKAKKKKKKNGGNRKVEAPIARNKRTEKRRGTERRIPRGEGRSGGSEERRTRNRPGDAGRHEYIHEDSGAEKKEARRNKSQAEDEGRRERKTEQGREKGDQGARKREGRCRQYRAFLPLATLFATAGRSAG